MTSTKSPTLELTSYIGGAWRPGATTAPDTNPADPTDQVASVSLADSATAAHAVRTAREAFPDWRATGAAARAAILRRAADLLDERAEEIGRDLTREEGKTFLESVRETRLSANIFRYFAGQALEPDGETYPSHQAGVLLFTRRGPVGVVSVITPWNFPICIPAWKIAPALAFGNTVVWKPAENVPLTAVHLTRVFVDAGLPAGVLNLVLGKGSQIGDVLTEHDDVDAITFTGSNTVGRGIQTRAAARSKRVQLELGGKNPAIVLADADLDLAAEQVSISAFSGSGQKCTATSRVIVERPALPKFVDLLKERAEAWRLGDPLDPATTLGPVSSDAQLRTVTGYLDQAVRDGAKAITGGDGPGGTVGCFVRPTIFIDVDPSHAVAREEIFGPVAAILPADSYEEAVALANDTPYGLSASLFTTNLARALSFADDSHTGIVKVNQATTGVEYHVPFGGMKESGFGQREQSKAARDFFTESKTVYINPA